MVLGVEGLHDVVGRWEGWSRCLVGPERMFQGSIDAYERPGLQILPAKSFTHIAICKWHYGKLWVEAEVLLLVAKIRILFNGL